MLTVRRAGRRVNVLSDRYGIILVDVPTFNTTGRLINLGENGLAVQFASPVPNSTTVEVDFPLRDRRLAAICETIWSKPTSRGLRFLTLAAEQRREIRLWMERRAGRRVNVLSDRYGIILVDVPTFKTTGRLINLGENGLAVQFASPVPNSTTVEVDFPLGDRRLTDTCETIWSQPTSRGLRFLTLAAEQRREIRLWMEALRLTESLPSDPQVSRTSDGAAARHAEQPATHDENVLCEESLVADIVVPDPHAATKPTAAGDSYAKVGEAIQGNEADVQHLQNAKLTTADPDAASVALGIASSAAVSGVPPNRIRQDWAARMVERQQIERLERLKSWHTELWAGYDLPGGVARSTCFPAAAVIPPTQTVAMNDNIIEGALTDAAVTPDSTPVARHQRRTLGTPHHQRGSSVSWLIILAISAAALVFYLTVLRNDGTSQARTSESAMPPSTRVARVVEIVEGEPGLHSHVGAKALLPKITPGTAILRDMPAYNNLDLAPGVQADVRAVLTINERGIVVGIRVIGGTTGLAKEVTAAAAHWRYTPYLLDSKPVTVDLPITVKFRAAGGGRYGKVRITTRVFSICRVAAA